MVHVAPAPVFARLGGLHRNTYLNSPRLLDGELRLKAMPRLRFAGQVTGVEGYVESAAIGLLADAASPVALFTIGAVLARSQRVASSQGQGPMPWRDFVPVSVAKLVLHPLLVAGMAWGLRALGLPLDPFAATVLVLVAALPSASNVPMLAERFGADAGRLARAVMASTAIAFATFTLVVMVVVPPTLIQA